MYTECTIRFIDDGTRYESAIIKSDYTVIDEEDEEIFFYGLTPEELERICRDGEICEGEWVVESINGVYDNL